MLATTNEILAKYFEYLLCHLKIFRRKRKVYETIGFTKSVESSNTSKDSQHDKYDDSLLKKICYTMVEF